MLQIAGKRDAREAGKNLSASSAAEILASGGWTNGERYLRAMINRSLEAYALRAPNGKLMAVYGLHPAPGGWVAPWVVTTHEAARYPSLLLTVGRAVVDSWRDAHPNMICYVHGLDTKGLKFAAALGLRPEIPEARGPHGGLFCRIVIETKKLEVG